MFPPAATGEAPGDPAAPRGAPRPTWSTPGGSPRRCVFPLDSGCSPHYTVACLTDSFISFMWQQTNVRSATFRGVPFSSIFPVASSARPNCCRSDLLCLFSAWAGKAHNFDTPMCHAPASSFTANRHFGLGHNHHFVGSAQVFRRIGCRSGASGIIHNHDTKCHKD